MRKLALVITVIFLFSISLFAASVENSATIAGVNGYIVIQAHYLLKVAQQCNYHRIFGNL